MGCRPILYTFVSLSPGSGRDGPEVRLYLGSIAQLFAYVERPHDLINMVTERENVPENCGYRGPGGNREPREHQGVRGAAAGEVPEGQQG